jgi:hypothetical protein
VLASKFISAGLAAQRSKNDIEEWGRSVEQSIQKFDAKKTLEQLGGQRRVLTTLQDQLKVLYQQKRVKEQTPETIHAPGFSVSGKKLQSAAKVDTKDIDAEIDAKTQLAEAQEKIVKALEDQYIALTRISSVKGPPTKPIDKSLFGDVETDEERRKRLRAIQDGYEREIALSDIQTKDEERQLQNRIALLNRFIVAEEGAGREREDIWIKLTEQEIAAQNELAELHKTKLDEKKQLEKAWLDFQLDAGQISKQERLRMLEEELATMMLFGQIGTEEELALLRERLELQKEIIAEKLAAEKDASKERLRFEKQVQKEIIRLGTDAMGSVIDTLIEGKRLSSEFFTSLIADITKAIAKMYLLRAVMSIFGPTAVGSGLFGLGFAASGANARMGQPFIVGERGPELFIPGRSGQIAPIQSASSAPSMSFDFSSFPAARNSLEHARDGEWQRFLRESIRVAEGQGFRGRNT